MRLRLTTSFLTLNLALFEPDTDPVETLLSNVAGSYEIAPVEEYEYTEGDPDEGFGFTAP